MYSDTGACEMVATQLQTVATSLETLDIMLYDNPQAREVVKAGRRALAETVAKLGMVAGAPRRPEGVQIEYIAGGSREGVRRRSGGWTPGGRI